VGGVRLVGLPVIQTITATQSRQSARYVDVVPL
jgi:hypothetical protein